MSDTRTKLRAVFMTALLIGSVLGGTIAFTGSVAAANAALNQGSVSPDTAEADSTQTYTVTATIDNVDTGDGTTDAYANFSFADFDLSSASVTNQAVVSTGSDTNTTNVGTNDGNNSGAAPFVNITWDDNNGATDDTIEISFDVESVVAPSSSGDQTVNLDADTNADGSENITSMEVGTVSVSTDTGLTFNESTSDVTEEDANVNVSVTDDDGFGVAEDTINVSVYNTQTGEEVSLVDEGEVVNGDAVGESNFTDGDNNVTEYVNLSVALQEGDYQINASAQDINSNLDETTHVDSTSFNVNMAGDALKVVPDDTNPLAGDAANVNVVAVDQNGNELLFNDSNVGATMADLQLGTDDPDNVSINRSLTSDSQVPINYNGGEYNVTFGVTYSEVADLEITAYDFGGNLTSGTATQTYTAEVAGVTVNAADGSLQADGSETENVTLQLVDQNGDPVPRAGVNVDFGVISGNSGAAGLDVAEDATTNSEGQAVATYNATESGYTIEVAGQTDNYQDTATFNTTPGQVSATESSFELNGDTSDRADVQVATTHNLTITILDSKQNPIPEETVEIAANGSEIANSPVTTNDSGVATTTVTLPEDVGTTQLNVTAGAFNASATDAAQINVTTKAANASTLQFTDDSVTNIAPESTDNPVTVEVYDEYGNLNTSVTNTVTLESSDSGVVDFDGSESTNANLGNGNVSFNVDANGTGTATLSATTQSSDITNVSQDVTVASPTAIELSFNHNVATSEATSSSTQTTATLTAQLVDADGNELGLEGENISFARQTGNAAELNQYLEDFTKSTDANGAATIQVNGTVNTGDTTFIGLAENYSIQGEGTITTTGPADTIQVTADSSTVAPGESTNVTVSFVDTEDRVVPKTTSVQLSTDFGSFDDSSESTAFNDDGQAVAIFNYTAPSDTQGETDITAVGGGLTGSTMLTVDDGVSAVELTDVSLSPDTVDSATTNDHTLTFDALNVSDDGNTDTFTVTIPDAATLESANDVTVTDADGDTVDVTGLDTSGNVITVDVAPDSSADYRDLTVDANVTVTAPDVAEETTADISIDAADSSNGDDATAATLTVQPVEQPTANFAVTSLEDTPADDPAPGEVVQGETFTVNVTVENTGDAAGTQDVSYMIDGTQYDVKQDVALDAGESTTLTFEIQIAEDADAPSTQTHATSTDDDSQSFDLDVYELGDVNHDGEVGSADATFVQRHIVNLPVDGLFDSDAADVNGDGTIGSADATLIQRLIVNLPI